jgi:DNA-binding MarR family transcriptional regulator/GNAT superfamily N-acetyltransferase
MTPGDHIEAIRHFNRFYTQKVGVLHEGLLNSPFSLAEARVLYELAHRDSPTAAELAGALSLDAGYLSRILRGFGGKNLIRKTASRADARQSHLQLTRKGRDAAGKLNSASRREISALLDPIPGEDRERLTQAMHTVESLLDPMNARPRSYVLRPHRPGDMGWIIHRHAVLYSQEYGWDERFEALVAEIAAGFINHYDARRERCWIAEVQGEMAGSVVLVKEDEMTAKLRLLLVEPKARGMGIGLRLVQECIQFARLAGYRKMTLWTNNNLDAARHIYRKTGFVVTKEEPHQSFGKDLVGETWELPL